MSQGIAITDLSARVVDAARTSKTRLITAESCTAGALTTLLADTPGAGDVLVGGVVTYSKSCKVDLLGIPPSLIASCSAVSAKVAAAMAQGALDKCPSADIAIAVTCVGGPKPDDDGNPVGLAYLAVQRRGAAINVRHLLIEAQSSGRIRGDVLARALSLLLEVLTSKG